MDDSPTIKKTASRGRWIRKPTLWIATGFGLGYSPVMPGTAGTLLGLPLAWAMSTRLDVGSFLALELVLLILGVGICKIGSEMLGKPDPSAVVFDEYVSLPLALFLIPFTWQTLLFAFVLHRVFDITKPWPVSAAERLPHGWGIMADDVVAAILANLVLHVFVALSWV